MYSESIYKVRSVSVFYLLFGWFGEFDWWKKKGFEENIRYGKRCVYICNW